MSFQHQIRPPVPLQTRRRNSRESLGQQHQQHQHQQQSQRQFSLDQIPTSVRRSGPASPLSITIPSPIDSGDKSQLSQKSQKASVHDMATDSDDKATAQDSQGDTTPRDKTAASKANGQIDEEDDEGSESDQSSICQSPSWEGYGQKKKDKKKKEAQQRKKEKERLDQELRAANKKKATNRLYKNPPPDSPDLNGQRERPPSSASTRLDSSHGPKSVRTSRMPEIWAIGMGSGMGGVPMSRPTYSRATSAAGSTTDQDPPRSSVQLQQSNASANRGLPTLPDERPTSSSNDKVSYPPTSSRSHALRSAPPAAHSRQTSSSTITTPALKPEEKNGQLYSTTNTSDQAVSQPTEPVGRGRQSAEPGAVSGSSYVRKARAQSIERSIKGFMQEAALSDPNLLNGPNRTQFAYLGPSQQQPQTNGHRPSSSHSRVTQSFTKTNGANGVSNGDASQPTSTTTVISERQERPKQHSHQQRQPEIKQPQLSRQQTARLQPEQLAPEKNELPEKEGDANTDYLNFVSKPYSPPSLDLTTPASGSSSGGGIFTSIKTRIGRRSSTSSGSTTNTNTGRSFKERAMGAMHLHGSQPSTPAAVPATPSQPPSRMHSQNSTQTASSSVASSTKNEASSSASTSHSLQIPHRDTRRLPKAARILGEINQETMSQGPSAPSRPSEGSSTSSYHDDSSVPPSPASTPDTSRPQSAKGLSATIEEIQIGSPNMFLPSQEDLSKPQAQQARASRVAPVEDHKTAEETIPRRPSSRTESVRDASVDRPRSKGRLLDDLERPTSRGRVLENVERPGSSGRVLEEVKPSQPTELSTKDIAGNDTLEASSSSSPDLAEGLGILDEAWSQSTVTPDNDAQSFVTTLTNQKSGTSLKSQFGNLKDAALLAEAQSALGVHPALVNHDIEVPAPPVYHNTLQEVDETDFANGGLEAEKTHLRNNNLRKKEKRNGQHAKHMSVVSEEPRQADDHLVHRATSPVSAAAGNDPRKTSTDVSFLPPLRHEAFVPPKSKARNSAPPPPRSQEYEAQVTYNEAPAAHHPEQAFSSSGRSSPSAMYLQEARRSAPLVSSPLSNIIRSTKANMSTPSLARPGLKTSVSFSGATGGYLPLPPPSSSSSSSASSSAQQPASASVPTSPQFRIPAHEPEQFNKAVSSANAKPLAKMLVECCNCKFFHDMPSRVYECMAQPDAVVTDRDLGVSGAITTMVKCPWCSHNMSTQCCAGYAAVVYLKERMH
ncbi:hypothetical protein SBRCBS47491_000505 [Sporothrix bragantina]|uniref:Uncharacterized protein n=1 Tax=Sporothrix bragantina TaxID=671064 RepID=A0ABP0AQS6_9PEZI